jgi:predicted amidophosphoribosyltransferase
MDEGFPFSFGIKDPLAAAYAPLKNVSTNKKLDSIKNAIIKEKQFKRKVNILLIDDLYESGTTLNETVNVLKTDNNVDEVYVLVMTKTGRR